MTDNVRT